MAIVIFKKDFHVPGESKKKVYAFDELWNIMYVPDIQD